MLETVTVGLMRRLGLDARMSAEGMIEGGVNLADGERLIRIDLEALIGRHVMVYGQTEQTRDLIAAAPERGLEIVFEAGDLALHDLDSDHPTVSYFADGETMTIAADFVAGCDGFHGPSRKNIRQARVSEFQREYPFGWLGILADVPPCHPELIYSNGTRSRYYIQVPQGEQLDAWRRSGCGTNWRCASTGFLTTA